MANNSAKSESPPPEIKSAALSDNQLTTPPTPNIVLDDEPVSTIDGILVCIMSGCWGPGEPSEYGTNKTRCMMDHFLFRHMGLTYRCNVCFTHWKSLCRLKRHSLGAHPDLPIPGDETKPHMQLPEELNLSLYHWKKHMAKMIDSRIGINYFGERFDMGVPLELVNGKLQAIQNSGGTDDQQRCAAVCTLVGAPDGRGSTNHSASADVPQSSQPPDGMQIVQTKDLVYNPFPLPLPAAYYYGNKKDLLDWRNRDRDYWVPSNVIPGMYAFVPCGDQTKPSGLCFCPGCCGEDGENREIDHPDMRNIDLMFDP